MTSPRYVLQSGRPESVSQLTPALMAAIKYLVIESVVPRIENNWLATFSFSDFAAVCSLALLGLPYRSDRGIDSDKGDFLDKVRNAMPRVHQLSYEEVVEQDHGPFPSMFVPWSGLTCLSLTVMRFNEPYVTWMKTSISTLTNITLDGQLQKSMDGRLALGRFFKLNFQSLKVLNLGILSSYTPQDGGVFDTEALHFIASHPALTHLSVCGRQPHGSSAPTPSSFFERIPKNVLLDAATRTGPFLPNLVSFRGLILDLASVFPLLADKDVSLLPPSQITHLSLSLRGTDEPSQLAIFGARDRPQPFNHITFLQLDFLPRMSSVSLVGWLNKVEANLCVSKDVKELSISSMEALNHTELGSEMPFLEFDTLERLILRTTSTPFLFPGGQISGPPDIVACNQVFAQTLSRSPSRSLKEIVLTSGNDCVSNTILTVDQSSGTLRL